MFDTVDIKKIVKELQEVLAKNQVPIKALDNIIDELKNTVYIHTIIQSNDLNKSEKVEQFKNTHTHDNEFIPSTSDGMGTGVNNYSSSKSE
ncbi:MULTISPECIES: hypothetical protein [Clostridium]|uniref:Virion-associated protein n=1 Tax=Clostridium carnis TaxID=1530 RepID=A0ABY6SWN1_9CLOT|nr:MULTISPECIES: hypothetical protein [Clostridium]CAI3596643.1 hypothetical protein CNEO4_1460088 [Clostridium neonatale]CAI3608652.1 hypothetical protein CNEO4_1600084 [Clostridium neonatale]CAI3630038.1 hypothetical protein CNEO3_370049 [Clostridium neonatale]CAI3660445.1 hypothetical protein CNEO3_420048 [Clostridium neonatale]CAI3662309.1 hypothetical protein CNEO3_390049 [Clostridium neonatale]